MKKKKNHFSVKEMTVAAMLAAMSVVIGLFCKSVLNFGNGLFRITFENIPIILSGVLFGPIVGGSVGAISDILSYLLTGQSYPLNIVVTLGAVAIGVVSGLVAKFIIKQHGTKQFVLSGGLAHIVGSMIIKPIGLFQFYGWAILFRIPLYLVIAPIEILLLSLLYNKSGFKRLVDEVEKD